jgi:DNA transformation protein and related proteins
MPAAPHAFADHCLELLAGLGLATRKRMFGGHALYLDGLIVGLIVADTLYLKTDAETSSRFEAAGCKPFQYARHDREVIITSYWSAPDDALESPALLAPWVRLAQAASLRARAKAPMPRSRPSRKR